MEADINRIIELIQILGVMMGITLGGVIGIIVILLINKANERD